MILALGARGREFDSPLAPFLFLWISCQVGVCRPPDPRYHLSALLAQMVERKTFNLVVAGSIPAEGASFMPM